MSNNKLIKKLRQVAKSEGCTIDQIIKGGKHVKYYLTESATGFEFLVTQSNHREVVQQTKFFRQDIRTEIRKNAASV